jgi:hypothetical protein
MKANINFVGSYTGRCKLCLAVRIRVYYCSSELLVLMMRKKHELRDIVLGLFALHIIRNSSNITVGIMFGNHDTNTTFPQTLTWTQDNHTHPHASQKSPPSFVMNKYARQKLAIRPKLCKKSSQSESLHTNIYWTPTSTSTHIHPRAPTRTHTHPHALTRTHTHTDALTRTHTHPHALTRTHTHSHALTRTLTHPHALTLTHKHTDELTRLTRTLTHSHATTRTHMHPPSHTRNHPHSHAP